MQPGGVWALKPMADMTPRSSMTGNRCSRNVPAWSSTSSDARSCRPTSPRGCELGVDDYTLYFRQVTDGPRGAVEWSTLLDRLTVQETRFFRHGPSFDLLGAYLRERVAKGLDSPSPSGASVVPAAKSRIPWPSRPPRPSRAASGPTILV